MLLSGCRSGVVVFEVVVVCWLANGSDALSAVGLLYCCAVLVSGFGVFGIRYKYRAIGSFVVLTYVLAAGQFCNQILHQSCTGGFWVLGLLAKFIRKLYPVEIPKKFLAATEHTFYFVHTLC